MKFASIFQKIHQKGCALRAYWHNSGGARLQYVHQSTTAHMCKAKASTYRTSTELWTSVQYVHTWTHISMCMCVMYMHQWTTVEWFKVKLNAYICMYGGCVEGLQGVGLIVNQPFWSPTTLDGVAVCDQNCCMPADTASVRGGQWLAEWPKAFSKDCPSWEVTGTTKENDTVTL